VSDYQDQLEELIDRYGIADVLHCLMRICDAKAEHVASNWQDASLAKRWAKLANILQDAKTGVNKL
jgi:hypothetical protein